MFKKIGKSIKNKFFYDFIEVIHISQIYLFKVYSSVAFIVFRIVQPLPQSVLLHFSHPLKITPYPLAVTFYLFIFLGSGNQESTFCLYRSVYSEHFIKNRIIQCSVSCDWLVSFRYCFQGSGMF